MADLELGCTPGLSQGDDLYEKLNALAWQTLHDAGATRRGTLVQLQVWEQHSQPVDEIELLRSRVAALDQFIASQRATAATCVSHDRAECPAMRPASAVMPAERLMQKSGGWRSVPEEAAATQWAGSYNCDIRVLTAEEWLSVSPCCLSEVFAAPFIVRAGGASAACSMAAGSAFGLGSSHLSGLCVCRGCRA